MEKNLQIFGARAIIEAIEAGKEIDKVYLQRGLTNNLTSELNTLIKKNGIQTSYVPIEKLNKLTQKNHQGAVATISPITFHDFEELVIQTIESGQTPLFILLDQLSDVRNFGAIIRTAACTGVHGIIIPKKGGAPINADTVKTSAGAAFQVPIAKVDHLKDAIYYLQGSGVQVVSATEKSEDAIYAVDATKPTAIVMGSEDRGVSSGVLKISDHTASLPMQGNIASLNVSVACGVFLYEVVRQRLS
jgi:23S rRNA (guanosine2251-2'-O)-methyltransferase